MTNVSGVVNAYELERPVYESLSARINAVLIDILKNNSIDFHVIEARAKTVKSFADKITRTGKNYIDPLSDISDLCGCRVILYYLDDVEKVREILAAQFEILEEERSHQADQQEVDRFGYISLHVVITVGGARLVGGFT